MGESVVVRCSAKQYHTQCDIQICRWLDRRLNAVAQTLVIIVGEVCTCVDLAIG